MNITLSKPQAEFFSSTAKVTAAIAGFGAGKTEAGMFRMITTMLEHPTADMLYCAPTHPLIKDVLWSKISDFLPSIGVGFTINKSESIVYLHGFGKIFCRSMDSPDRLVGFEVLSAFLDELDILATDKAVQVFHKVKARVRQKVKDTRTGEALLNQIFVTTTPEGFRGSYELFKKNPAPGTRLIQMSTYSNRHNLPSDYISDLKATYPPQLIDAYLMGKFVNLNALGVWSSYDADKNHMSVEVIKGEPIIIGQDFNVGRGACIPYVWRVLDANHPKNTTDAPLNVLVACGEVVDTFDTDDSIRALNEMFPKHLFVNRTIFPDASGDNRKSVNATITDISMMKHASFKVTQPNKNSPIKDRVTASNAAFCNAQGVRKVFVDKFKAPCYSDALVQQAYDKNGLPEKGALKGDDLTDAGTYPLVHFFPLKANKMFTRSVRGL